MSESLACLDRLDRVVLQHPAPSASSWSDIHRYCALARAYVALSLDQPQNAISVLEKLQRDADDAHNYYFGLRVSAHLAIAHLRAGDRAEALTVFRMVLNKCVQAGLYQSMLDLGPEIGTLLSSVREDAPRTGDSPDFVAYLDRLIEGFRARYEPQVKASPASAIEELLSVREGDILNLIAEGRSNKEIARILSIAPETVKSHVKNTFIKLKVQTRAQAVSRAQTVGLLNTP